MSAFKIVLCCAFVVSWLAGVWLQFLIARRLLKKPDSQIIDIFGYPAKDHFRSLAVGNSKSVLKLMFSKKLKSLDPQLHRICVWSRVALIVMTICMAIMPFVMLS